jgi:hypothetical protein
MTKRYVSGKRNRELQSNCSDNARNLLRAREASPEWFAKHYPIIYELVPVSAESLKPKIVAKPHARRRK